MGESDGKKMALAHVAMCPGRLAWLEGVRVHPDFRRARVATALLDRMLAWAAKKGAREASAIVSQENAPSQRMLERNGFSMKSAWIYHGTGRRLKKHATAARIATKSDLAGILKFLHKSRIYALSARRYVSSWQWYFFDATALRRLVSEDRVVVTGRPVDGVAVLNRAGYWDKPSILQVAYLDSNSAKSLKDLLAFAANLYVDGYSSLHVLCHNSKKMTSAAEKLGVEESEIFLLYSKKVFT